MWIWNARQISMQFSLRVFDLKALLDKSKTLCYASKYFKICLHFHLKKTLLLRKLSMFFVFFLNFIIFSCPALFREKTNMGTILSTFSLMEFFSRNDFPLKTILVLDMLREMCWDVSQLSIWIRLSGLRTSWRDWNVSGLSFQFVRAHRLLKLSLWLLNIFCYFFYNPD